MDEGHGHGHAGVDILFLRRNPAKILQPGQTDMLDNEVLEFSKNSFPRIQYIGICLALCCHA
jgi:hypothetical protein